MMVDSARVVAPAWARQDVVAAESHRVAAVEAALQPAPAVAWAAVDHCPWSALLAAWRLAAVSRPAAPAVSLPLD
jgi:hypothetical protein